MANAWLYAAPLWAFLLFYVVRSVKDWPGVMQRWNERVRDRAEIDGDQYRRMDARMQRLEKAEEKCRYDLADAERRIAELEGYNIGRGKADQEAAAIVAAERLRGRKG